MAKSDIGAAEPRIFTPAQAKLLLLGGAGALEETKIPVPDAETAAFFAAHEAACASLIPSAEASVADYAAAARFLAGLGVKYASLSGVSGGEDAGACLVPGGIRGFGAGVSRALAESPAVAGIGGVRVGFLALNEPDGAEGGPADVLDPRVFDRVRMLLPQCDHVLVFCRAGLRELGLPLPEWRERARLLLRAGASVVVFTLPGEPDGWEEFEGGLILYGLGALAGGNGRSLAVSLTLRQNHLFTYEARLLEQSGGALAFSKSEEAKSELNARNALLFDACAYRAEADRRCLAYVESEAFHAAYMPGRDPGRGFIKGLLHAKDDAREQEERALCALLESESPLFAARRGLAAKYGGRDD